MELPDYITWNERIKVLEKEVDEIKKKLHEIEVVLCMQ